MAGLSHFFSSHIGRTTADMVGMGWAARLGAEDTLQRLDGAMPPAPESLPAEGLGVPSPPAVRIAARENNATHQDRTTRGLAAEG